MGNPYGRPKSSPAYQELSGMQMCRRSDVTAADKAATALQGPPPKGLKGVGKTTWNHICAQQKSYVESNIAPNVTMSEYPVALQYCRVAEELELVRRNIADHEKNYTAKDRHNAIISMNDKGVPKMHPLYKLEAELETRLVKLSTAMRISKTTPQIAMQQNNFMNTPPDQRVPGSDLLLVNRLAKEVVDVTPED